MCKETMLREFARVLEIQERYSDIVDMMQCELLKKNKDYDMIDALMSIAHEVKHEFEEQFEIYRAAKKQYWEERKAV